MVLSRQGKKASGTSRMKSKPDRNLTYRLYLLAGQSNMEGMGFVRDLPPSLGGPVEGAAIYHPNRKDDGEPPEGLGCWEQLRPGHGYGHRVDREKGRNLLSDRFGIELSFARKLQQLSAGRRIAIFKYAKGGATIHPNTPDDWGCWDPDYEQDNGINQWSHFSYHYRRAIAFRKVDSHARNENLKPSGILWLQGESDASYTREIAEAYARKLDTLIARMRGLIGNPELPVIIGEISDYVSLEGKSELPWAPLVQKAQQAFVERDENAALVKAPDDHGWLDRWHYDSRTYIELGKRFADAVHHLEGGMINDG